MSCHDVDLLSLWSMGGAYPPDQWQQCPGIHRKRNLWTVMWHCLWQGWKLWGDQTMSRAPWPVTKESIQKRDVRADDATINCLTLYILARTKSTRRLNKEVRWLLELCRRWQKNPQTMAAGQTAFWRPFPVPPVLLPQCCAASVEKTITCSRCQPFDYWGPLPRHISQ